MMHGPTSIKLVQNDNNKNNVFPTTQKINFCFHYKDQLRSLIVAYCDTHMILINRLRGQSKEILSDKNEW